MCCTSFSASCSCQQDVLILWHWQLLLQGRAQRSTFDAEKRLRLSLIAIVDFHGLPNGGEPTIHRQALLSIKLLYLLPVSVKVAKLQVRHCSVLCCAVLITDMAALQSE